jgi:hypothetical protein
MIDAAGLTAAPAITIFATGRRNFSPGCASMSWDKLFSEPILLADGRKLRTLRDAAIYITALPKVERDAAPWQTAAELLLLVAGERRRSDDAKDRGDEGAAPA